MSTAAAQLLVSSSAVSSDLCRFLIGSHLSRRNELWLSRVCIIIIGIIACIIALNPKNSILSLILYAWAGLGASFGPVILLSLFWKRANLTGAFYGMLTGALTVLIWPHLKTFSLIFQLQPLLPAFLGSLFINVSISLIFGAPNKKVSQNFDKMLDIEREI